MTVAELIQALEHVDGALPVRYMCFSDYGRWFPEVRRAYTITLGKFGDAEGPCLFLDEESEDAK